MLMGRTSRAGHDPRLVRLICSYCRKTIRADPGSRVTDVSHGMCRECGEHFARLWAGMPLGEYLDELGAPVVLTDGDGRVVAMNRQLGDLLGVDPADSSGLRAGEVFACVRSRLPEGCGGNTHCRDCAVRRSVETVSRTGKPQEQVSAYLDVDAGRIDLRVTARPARAGVVQVKIEEMGSPRPRKKGDA
jgi:PAS domain-containing protein